MVLVPSPTLPTEAPPCMFSFPAWGRGGMPGSPPGAWEPGESEQQRMVINDHELNSNIEVLSYFTTTKWWTVCPPPLSHKTHTHTHTHTLTH